MKVNGIEVLGNKFAYDGCHKIYILEDEADEQETMKIGYKVMDISKLEETYENSCELRFIHNWKLDKCYAPQFEKAVFEK